MNSRFLLPAALGLGLLAMNCAGPSASGAAESREVGEYPDWSQALPSREGFIIGVGRSKKQNPRIAKQVAAQNARTEIATSIKDQVESLITAFMLESGLGERTGALEFSRAVSAGVSRASLNGAMIKDTFLAKDGTYFILMEYSLESARRAAIDSARHEAAVWNDFKADRGFEALEKELAKLR